MSRSDVVSRNDVVRRNDVRDRLETGRVDSLAAAEASPPGSSVPARAPRALGLESELQLVDAMRGAVQRNDTRALRGLVDSYRGSFPEGQLREEVAELALRALPPR